MKRIGRLLGVAIGILGVVFVVRELNRNWDDVSTALRGANALILLGALAVGLISMSTIGLAWRRCLRVMGVEQPTHKVLRSYYVGQLGKYVPGGIWPVVGRSEMARRDGVSGAVAYASTLVSMALTYTAAGLVAATAWLLSAAEDGAFLWWVVIVLLALVASALHPKVVRLGLRFVQRATRRELHIDIPSWRTSIYLLAGHIPAWIGISFATWLVAHTLDSVTPDFGNLIYATSISWLAGFLAIGVPGGIGVREGLFIASATLSSTGVAAGVAVVARVLFVVVDLTGAGFGTATAVWRRPDLRDPALTED